MNAPPVTVTMDPRGRVSLGKLIQRNGIAPATEWLVAFGPNQTITLSPAVVTERRLVG